MRTFITTIPGIGPVTGATILSEIGDTRNFERPEQLVAFAGLDPVVKESGKSHTVLRISKRGSPSLRLALCQAAGVGRMYNPVLKPYYGRLRTQGRAYREAVVACARKLCHIVFSVLREDRPFTDEPPKRQ